MFRAFIVSALVAPFSVVETAASEAVVDYGLF